MRTYTEEDARELEYMAREKNEREPVIERATYKNGIFVFHLAGSALPGVSLSIPASSFPQLAEQSEEARAHMISTGWSVRWPTANFGIGALQLVEVAIGKRHLSLRRALGDVTPSTA